MIHRRRSFLLALCALAAAPASAGVVVRTVSLEEALRQTNRVILAEVVELPRPTSPRYRVRVRQTIWTQTRRALPPVITVERASYRHGGAIAGRHAGQRYTIYKRYKSSVDLADAAKRKASVLLMLYCEKDICRLAVEDGVESPQQKAKVLRLIRLQHPRHE
jgi:hypothetical protein